MEDVKHTGRGREKVLSMSFHPTMPLVAFGCDTSCVRLWNLKTRMYLRGGELGHLGRVHSVRFSSDGQFLISAASADPTYDTPEGKGALAAAAASSVGGPGGVALTTPNPPAPAPMAQAASGVAAGVVGTNTPAEAVVGLRTTGSLAPFYGLYTIRIWRVIVQQPDEDQKSRRADKEKRLKQFLDKEEAKLLWGDVDDRGKKKNKNQAGDGKSDQNEVDDLKEELKDMKKDDDDDFDESEKKAKADREALASQRAAMADVDLEKQLRIQLVADDSAVPHFANQSRVNHKETFQQALHQGTITSVDVHLGCVYVSTGVKQGSGLLGTVKEKLEPKEVYVLASASEDFTVRLWDFTTLASPAAARLEAKEEETIKKMYELKTRLEEKKKRDEALRKGKPIVEEKVEEKDKEEDELDTQREQLLRHLNDGKISLPPLRRQILRKHKGPVTSLAFSPDGAMLVSGGLDGQVIAWKLSLNRQERHLYSHSAIFTVNNNDPVYSVAFFPDVRIPLINPPKPKNKEGPPAEEMNADFIKPTKRGHGAEYLIAAGTSSELCVLRVQELHIPTDDSDPIEAFLQRRRDLDRVFTADELRLVKRKLYSKRAVKDTDKNVLQIALAATSAQKHGVGTLCTVRHPVGRPGLVSGPGSETGTLCVFGGSLRKLDTKRQFKSSSSAISIEQSLQNINLGNYNMILEQYHNMLQNGAVGNEEVGGWGELRCWLVNESPVDKTTGRPKFYIRSQCVGRHDDRITAIAAPPLELHRFLMFESIVQRNEMFVLSGSADSTVKVWHVGARQVQHPNPLNRAMAVAAAIPILIHDPPARVVSKVIQPPGRRVLMMRAGVISTKQVHYRPDWHFTQLFEPYPASVAAPPPSKSTSVVELQKQLREQQLASAAKKKGRAVGAGGVDSGGDAIPSENIRPSITLHLRSVRGTTAPPLAGQTEVDAAAQVASATSASTAPAETLQQKIPDDGELDQDDESLVDPFKDTETKSSSTSIATTSLASSSSLSSSSSSQSAAIEPLPGEEGLDRVDEDISALSSSAAPDLANLQQLANKMGANSPSPAAQAAAALIAATQSQAQDDDQDQPVEPAVAAGMGLNVDTAVQPEPKLLMSEEEEKKATELKRQEEKEQIDHELRQFQTLATKEAASSGSRACSTDSCLIV